MTGKLAKVLALNDKKEIVSKTTWRETFSKAQEPAETVRCANASCYGFMIKREDSDLCEKCETGK